MAATAATAATEDVQQINDAFAVMQRAAKGKAKAITQTQTQPEQLPWYVSCTRLTRFACSRTHVLTCSRAHVLTYPLTHVGQGRKVQTDNARRGRIPQRHYLDK